MKKKLIAMLMLVVMIGALLAGCGKEKGKETGSVSQGESTKKEEKTPPKDENITIKVFSNLPDRKNGQGLVEQMIIDEYMELNKNVTIEVEALDEEAYKTKFKAYAMNGMPDVVSIWGQPSFIDEVLDAGVLAELNETDYNDYKFISGSLEGFKKDGKLYGLPRNSDVMAFYYNQKIFEDNGWKVPATYEELLLLGKTIKEAGMVPVAMDGGDGWPLAILLTDLLLKVNGDCSSIVTPAVAQGNFTSDEMKKTTGLLVEAAKSGLFQTGYDSQDYGTAMNLFTNGQAAMFYMGSWETSMARNQDISEEIRNNIRAFTMPVVEGGKGKATDIAAWNGGGYAVSAHSEVKGEAIKFLNFMYQPDKLSKYGWENGVGMSAQDQTEFLSGNETELQMQFMEFLKNATSVSGTPINDCGPSIFKTVIESEIQSVSNGTKSVDEFLTNIGLACK
ncbi:ABC transporter substrate-binding protein [Anaerocolumna aminovalerica]|uniref:ABC transporter substrate-binding protein n=1 Tax=Anaerocolumna aminovalerica TaxID=1527 RepID=UPI000BE2817D|nr:extracellular solute-binding protein [Anaerocolumna aminovalerica]